MKTIVQTESIRPCNCDKNPGHAAVTLTSGMTLYIDYDDRVENLTEGQLIILTQPPTDEGPAYLYEEE